MMEVPELPKQEFLLCQIVTLDTRPTSALSFGLRRRNLFSTVGNSQPRKRWFFCA